MDISSRLARKSEEIKRSLEQKADIGSFVTSMGVYGGNIPPERKASDYLKSATGWVYACAGVIADEVAKIDIRLFRQKGKEAVEIESHPALDLLYRANIFTTKFDLFWMTAQFLELTGEAPWFLSYAGNKPDQILLLRPDCLTVKTGSNGEVLGGYNYRIQGKDIFLEPREVVFLRYPDPNSSWGFRGKGPLQAAARTVDIDEFSEEYNKRFFYNSAKPDGVLKTENKLGKDQIDTLEKKFNQRYKGLDNAHKTLILEKGLEWQSMALSQKDMDFMEQQKFSRDKILGIFRVPRTVLGITDDVNRANAEATDYVFAKRTIEPKLERIVQQLNEFLLPMFTGTEGMFFDFDSPVPEDVASKRAFQTAALANGWLTINEVRAMDGYDGVGSDGDVIHVPSSLVPLGEEGFANFAARPQKLKSLDRVRQSRKRIKKEKKINVSRIEKALFKIVKGKLLAKKKKVVKKKEAIEIKPVEAKVQQFQDKQLNIATDFEKQFTSKITGVFRAQRDAVLAKMPGKSIKDLSWEDFLLLPAREKKRFIAALSQAMTDLIIAQSAEAFAFVGQDDSFDAGNPAVIDYLSKRAFKFALPTTRLTNRILSNEFKAGIAAGESIAQLRKRVESVFDGMEKYRSERIARSETIRASNYAAEESYKQSGVVEGKEWLVSADDRLCDWCASMPGRGIRPLGENWLDKGDRVGDLKIDYEDIGAPPLHPNCRCTLVPVVNVGRSVKRARREDEIDSAINKLEQATDDGQVAKT